MEWYNLVLNWLYERHYWIQTARLHSTSCWEGDEKSPENINILAEFRLERTLWCDTTQYQSHMHNGLNNQWNTTLGRGHANATLFSLFMICHLGMDAREMKRNLGSSSNRKLQKEGHVTSSRWCHLVFTWVFFFICINKALEHDNGWFRNKMMT